VYALYSNATIGNYTEGDPAIQFWSQTLSSSPTAPCIATGKVFVSAGSTLYAFDMYSQKTLWYYTWSGYYAYEPVVADGHVFVPQYYGLSCFGEPFPPITYDFTVSVNGQPFVIELVANATVLTIDTSSLTTLKQIVYNLTGISGTTGMSNITMPKTLMSGFDASSVTVDGGLPLSGPVISENATHTSLYFTYTQSSHEVVIKATSVIPEYSPVLLLPLLLGTPLVVLAIARRKRII
jgi:outer membrane protein assembly factor BamB